MLAFLVAVLLSVFVYATPREQPSFDCLKAASLSEKTICANAELSRLDFQLGQMWKALLDDFIDPAQRTQMRQDQRTWIARRQGCGDDANCIGKLYRDRLSSLNGADRTRRIDSQACMR
jgi:uncharacterized protein